MVSLFPPSPPNHLARQPDRRGAAAPRHRAARTRHTRGAPSSASAPSPRARRGEPSLRRAVVRRPAMAHARAGPRAACSTPRAHAAPTGPPREARPPAPGGRPPAAHLAFELCRHNDERFKNQVKNQKKLPHIQQRARGKRERGRETASFARALDGLAAAAAAAATLEGGAPLKESSSLAVFI